MMAVGVWFYAQDTQRYLYLMRNDSKYPNTWGLPGGKCEAGETLLETIERNWLCGGGTGGNTGSSTWGMEQESMVMAAA